MQFNVQRLTARCKKLVGHIKQQKEELDKTKTRAKAAEGTGSVWKSFLQPTSATTVDEKAVNELKQALSVAGDELKVQIEEAAKARGEMLDLKAEQAKALDELQRKLNDMKGALDAKAEELSNALAAHKAAVAEHTKQQAEALQQAKTLMAELGIARQLNAEQEKKFIAQTRQLERDLSSLRARYHEKVFFDDSATSEWRRLNLPSFDRAFVSAKIGLAEEAARVVNKLDGQLQTLLNALASKLQWAAERYEQQAQYQQHLEHIHIQSSRLAQKQQQPSKR